VAGQADGAANVAGFNQPSGIAIDPKTGDALVADTGNHTIRRVSPAGVVSTEAGTTATRTVPTAGETKARAAAVFDAPEAIAVDSDTGSIYVADTGHHLIRRIANGQVTILAGRPRQSGDDNLACTQSRFSSPRGLVVTSDGAVLVADTENHVVRRIAGPGTRATGTACTVTAVVGDPGTPGANDSGAERARFDRPVGLVQDGKGALFVTDSFNGTLRRIAPDRQVSTFAGRAEQYGYTDSSPGPARFDHPGGLAIGPDGSLYVADRLNDTIRRISPSGVVSTLAGDPIGLAGFVDGPGAQARFDFPSHLVVSATGTVYISDSGNHAIRRMAPDGTVSTLAGAPVTDEFGDKSGDHVDGAAGEARFDEPQGLALSPDGRSLYVADSGNDVIRRIDLDSGQVSTVAGDPLDFGHRDGAASGALFFSPNSLAFDRQGRLVVADTGNFAIRRIDLATRQVETVAGFVGGSAHLDGVGADAAFDFPELIARDGAGNLFVGDGSTVRALIEQTDDKAYEVQTLYGQYGGGSTRAPQATLGPLPRSLGLPGGLVLSEKRLYFTSGSAVLFIDR
jgi:DNA-binding beta-propeller fold protein YncE